MVDLERLCGTSNYYESPSIKTCPDTLFCLIRNGSPTNSGKTEIHYIIL